MVIAYSWKLVLPANDYRVTFCKSGDFPVSSNEQSGNGRDQERPEREPVRCGSGDKQSMDRPTPAGRMQL